MIDNPAVIHAIVEEARAWSKDAENAGSELRRLIKLVAETQDSELFDAVKNIRDKYLAHALEFTRAEGRKAIRPMKYADERKMLEITMDVVENLYIWITGTHFDLADNKRMHGRYARELWENCHFDIKSR